MIKLKKIKKGFSKNNLSLAISALALVVSYCSYVISSDTLEYEKETELDNKSPSIILRLDSDRITFSLDKEDARLQTVIFKFPDSIQISPIITEGGSQSISLEKLNGPATNFFAQKLADQHSAPRLKIPVVIDFEAVVARKSTLYREDHFLVFDIVLSETREPKTLRFYNSRFNYELPCPQGYSEKTRKELKEYLDNRFQRTLEYLEQSGLIK